MYNIPAVGEEGLLAYCYLMSFELSLSCTCLCQLEFIVVNFQALNKLKWILQENVCLTLLPQNAHGITQRPTLKFSANNSLTLHRDL